MLDLDGVRSVAQCLRTGKAMTGFYAVGRDATPADSTTRRVGNPINDRVANVISGDGRICRLRSVIYENFCRTHNGHRNGVRRGEIDQRIARSGLLSLNVARSRKDFADVL